MKVWESSQRFFEGEKGAACESKGIIPQTVFSRAMGRIHWAQNDSERIIKPQNPNVLIGGVILLTFCTLCALVKTFV